MTLHSDIIKHIHKFEYNGHVVNIVVREKYEKFLYFYVHDIYGREIGGMNYVFFDDITEEDLMDLFIVVPKIKRCIDNRTSNHLKWEKETLQKKKDLNWTGQKFKRGDRVFFKGNAKYKAICSSVWTHFGHDGIAFYLIQHKDGELRDNWLAKPPFENRDGFECVHSSQLEKGLKYIQIDCSDEFIGETDELILLPKPTLI